MEKPVQWYLAAALFNPVKRLPALSVYGALTSKAKSARHGQHVRVAIGLENGFIHANKFLTFWTTHITIIWLHIPRTHLDTKGWSGKHVRTTQKRSLQDCEQNPSPQANHRNSIWCRSINNMFLSSKIKQWIEVNACDSLWAIRSWQAAKQTTEYQLPLWGLTLRVVSYAAHLGPITRIHSAHSTCGSLMAKWCCRKSHTEPHPRRQSPPRSQMESVARASPPATPGGHHLLPSYRAAVIALWWFHTVPCRAN